MNFTREDILKILNALLQLGRKDSEFKEANTPLNSDDYIVILLDGINKKVSINNLLSTLGLLKKDDFINVSDRYDEYYIQLSEAITIIANNKRKKGLVITFQDINGTWKIYQFNDEIVNFIKTEYWKDLFDFKYPIINTILPDEEDLTLTYPNIEGNSFIKLKDREYDSENFSGMATKIFRKNIKEIDRIKKNILTQEDFDLENCIYEIRYDFTLTGNVTIPTNCVLEFNGGSISGSYILTGNNTEIIAPLCKIIDKTVIPSGTWKAECFYPDWFGANGDNSIDNSLSIQRAIDFAKNNDIVNTVKFINNYRSDCPIFLTGKNVTVDGNNTTITFHYRHLGGRTGFVIGQSVEESYDVYIDKINNGESPYWKNPNFTNPPLARENIDQYIYDGSSYLQAKNCWIHDITIDFNYTTYSSGWGGYSINFANTLNCGCYNIISYHAHEAINVGSDVAPETPGNVGTKVWNIEAKEPSLNCYYAIGFICNSKNITLNDCRSIIKIEGTFDEAHSNLAISYTDHANIDNIVSELLAGSTEIGMRQGLEVNGSTNCVISNVYLKGWNIGLSTYCINTSWRNSNNYFNNVTLVNNRNGIALSDWHCFFNNIKCINNTRDLLFRNTNASNNHFQNHNITKIAGEQGGAITSAFQCLISLSNNLYPRQRYVIPVSAYLNSKYGQTLSIIKDTYGYTQFGDNDTFELRIPFNKGRIYNITMSTLITMGMAAADGNFGIKILNCDFAFEGYPSYSEVYSRTITGVTGQDRDINIDANLENLGNKSDYLILLTGHNVKAYSMLRNISVDVIKSNFEFTLV